jgi:signal transduction histidine kinase
MVLFLRSHLIGGFLLAGIAFIPAVALACGDSEAGASCSENATADDARWMLQRVVAEIKKDEPKALSEFTRGSDGYRTTDLYVFCIGSDGHIDAHPNPQLMGQDARTLQDQTGKRFAAEMLNVAKDGQVSEVKYLYPKPDSTIAVPKTSFVTRVNDQVCGVGFYE